MNQLRRALLKGSGAAGALAVPAAAGLLRPSQVLASEWNKTGFDAKTAEDALKSIGASATANSSDIVIKAPDIAENGAVVPIEVTSKIPGTQSIALVANKNPFPLVATFNMSNGAEGYVSVRIRMGQSANVRAVVSAGGKHYGKGPGSRLWPLRVDRKLAYGVDADLTWMISSGVIIAHLETDRNKAPDAAAALDRALDELIGTGVTEEEMAATKTMARARFLRAVEEKAPRLRTIGLFEILGIGPDTGAGFMGAIDAVTTDVFNAYIREALAPERALRVTVGPSAACPSQGGCPCPD